MFSYLNINKLTPRSILKVKKNARGIISDLKAYIKVTKKLCKHIHLDRTVNSSISIHICICDIKY